MTSFSRQTAAAVSGAIALITLALEEPNNGGADESAACRRSEGVSENGAYVEPRGHAPLMPAIVYAYSQTPPIFPIVFRCPVRRAGRLSAMMTRPIKFLFITGVALAGC